MKLQQVKNEKNRLELSQAYLTTLQELKDKIRATQAEAAVRVNQELINLYWEIGNSISQKQKEEGWGAKTINNFSEDLQESFPNMKGFSLTNMKYIVQFAKEYPDYQINQQAVGQIPWGHNVTLLQKLTTLEERLWYVKKVIENGHSRNALALWIDSKLYMRKPKALPNFERPLSDTPSDLASQTLKDPYLFDFLSLKETYNEEAIEESLAQHLQRFLLELGQGFSFVDRHYRLEINDNEHFLDLLFYHLDLRCYFVVKLKAVDFQAEDKQKLKVYLSAVDDILKKTGDNPAIGVLVYKGKNGTKIEYALPDIHSPAAAADFDSDIARSLPDSLKPFLPSIDKLETEMNRGVYEKA